MQSLVTLGRLNFVREVGGLRKKLGMREVDPLMIKGKSLSVDPLLLPWQHFLGVALPKDRIPPKQL